MAPTNDRGTKTICAENAVWCDHPLLLVIGGANSSDPLNDQIGLCECACLIEAADVDLTSKWNSERFSAEDLLLNQLYD